MPRRAAPKHADLASTVNALKSKYPGKVFDAGEYTMPWLLKRLPTGIIDIDIATNGGLPAGGMSFFVGKQGTGKNWMANNVMREHQLRYGDDTAIAVVSTEMVFDKQFAHCCGVKVPMSGAEIDEVRKQYQDEGVDLGPEELELLEESAGTFLTVPPSVAEESLEIAIDLISSRQFDIVLIDSFGSLLTEHDEDTTLMDSPRVSGAAGLNTRFSRKLNHALAPDTEGNPNLTCVIGINQVRDNMNRANKYSPALSEGGGWALKHARWLSLLLSPTGKLRDGKALIGKTVGWEITKQKAGGHEGARGSYDYLYGLTGIDRCAHSIRVAADHGVVERKGAWYSYQGQRIGQGATNAADHVREVGLLSEIEAATFRSAGVRHVW